MSRGHEHHAAEAKGREGCRKEDESDERATSAALSHGVAGAGERAHWCWSLVLVLVLVLGQVLVHGRAAGTIVTSIWLKVRG